VYNYTDHLGNIRLSYGIDPENFNVEDYWRESLLSIWIETQ
jgi:hypothetical protein